MGCSLASLARLFHLAAIRPDKSRGQGFLRARTYGVIGGAVNSGEKVFHTKNRTGLPAHRASKPH
jgi:hypothetical protein